jgi:predicted transcriptional regulator
VWYVADLIWRTTMSDEQESTTVDRAFAARIVAAYVRRNQIGSDELASLISTVHRAIADLGKPADAAISARTPAVSIRRSVQHDKVTCLECGWTGSMLRRHLTVRHRLTPDEYRARWKLPADHPLTAPGYSERRSTMAKQFGLGRARRASVEAPEPAAPRRRGRPRSAAASA